MLPTARSFFSGLLAVLLASAASFGLQLRLSDEAVREAYFLGQRHDQTMAAFFAHYLRHLPVPEKGPHISEIELLTPYAQVVAESERSSVSYSAQQAAEDYRRRGDTIVVRARIEFTPTYNAVIEVPQRGSAKPALGVRTEDFWKDFRFGLWQKEHWIDTRIVRGEPIYARPSKGGPSHLSGAEVWFECDAKKIDSTDATVEVFTPDGQHVIATFDLSQLR